MPCLHPHVGHEFRTFYSIVKPREILDDGGDHELSARNAAFHKSFKKKWLHIGTGSVYRRSQTRRSASDYYQIFRHFSPVHLGALGFWGDNLLSL